MCSKYFTNYIFTCKPYSRILFNMNFPYALFLKGWFISETNLKIYCLFNPTFDNVFISSLSTKNNFFPAIRWYAIFNINYSKQRNKSFYSNSGVTNFIAVFVLQLRIGQWPLIKTPQYSPYTLVANLPLRTWLSINLWEPAITGVCLLIMFSDTYQEIQLICVRDYCTESAVYTGSK